jgi:hypothetical protein
MSQRLIATTRGTLAESDLHRTVVLEDRPDHFAVLVRYQLPHADGRVGLGSDQFGEVVRQDAFRLPKETGPDIFTTLGILPASALERTVELLDRAQEIVVAVVWKHEGELVRRDAHVILKEPTTEAAAVAAALA